MTDVRQNLYGLQPIIDIPTSRAYDVTWRAMEVLVEKGKTRLIGKQQFLKMQETLLTMLCNAKASRIFRCQS